MGKKISDEILKKNNEIYKLSSSILDFDEIENSIRILSPNIYKAYDKLLANEKLFFVNNNNQYRGENLILGDTKEAINYLEVSNLLSDISNTIYSTIYESLYFGLGFLEWENEGSSFEKYKLPLVLVPITLLKQDEEFYVTVNYEFEKIEINPLVNLALKKSKNFTLPKIDTREKLYNFIDKISSLCEDNNLTVIEEGAIFSQDTTSDKLFFTLDKTKEELSNSTLLEYLLRDENENENDELLEKLSNIETDTKLQNVLDFTTAPFLKEDIDPLLLSNLNFSFNLEYSTFYDVEGVSNIGNIVTNILSGLLKDNKKVLFVSSEKNLDKVYQMFDETPLQSLIFNTTDKHFERYKREDFSSFVHKVNYKTLKDWDNRPYILGNKETLVSYGEFLDREVLPLRMSISNAIKKYFEYKEVCDEIPLNFENIGSLTMLDVHQYVHDINFFVKNHNVVIENKILENIWFTSNLSFSDDEAFFGISNKINSLKEETDFFIGKFEEIKKFVNIEYKNFGAFYSFCKKIDEVKLNNQFSLVDFDSKVLNNDLHNYNEEVERLYNNNIEIFSKFTDDINNVDFLGYVNKSEDAFDNIYKYVSYEKHDEDSILANEERIITLLKNSNIEISRIKTVYDELVKIFDFEYNRTIGDYEVLTSAFEIFYQNKTFKENLLNDRNINIAINELRELEAISFEINSAMTAIKKTFKDEVFNLNSKEFLEKVENIVDGGLTSIISFGYKKDKDFVKSYLVDDKEIKDTEYIRDKAYEFLLCTELIAKFDLKAKNIATYFDFSIDQKTDISDLLDSCLKIRNLLDALGGIPKKLKNVLINKNNKNVRGNRNTAINELFRKMSLKFDFEIMRELKVFLDNDSYCNLYTRKIEDICETFEEVTNDFKDIYSSYNFLNQYVIGNLPYTTIVNTLKMYEVALGEEEVNKRYFEKNIEPYIGVLEKNDMGIYHIKEETLAISKGKKLGLSFSEITDIINFFKSDKLNTIYNREDTDRFTQFSLEVSWLISILDLDFEVTTFDQLGLLVKRAYTSFEVVEKNREFFKVVLDKNRIETKSILLTLSNSNVEPDKYIDTFMISFYKEWVKEVSKDYDFTKRKLDESLENVQKAIYNQNINNSYKIYNDYSQKLPDIRFNKKYYDEIDNLVSIYDEDVTLRKFFKEIPNILQLYKPVIFISYEKLMKLEKFIHINFDTIILDKYGEKSFMDILPYFTKAKQSIFLYNTTYFDNFQTNIPTLKMKNFLIDKENKVVQILNDVVKNNYYNILGCDNLYTSVIGFKNDFDEVNKTSKMEAITLLDLLKNRTEPCNILFPTTKQKDYFKKYVAKEKYKLNYNVELYTFGDEISKNEELVICLSDKSLTTKIDGTHLNMLFVFLAKAKKVTLLTSIEEVIFEEDLRSIAKNFKVLVKYLLDNDIKQFNSVKRFAMNKIDNRNFSLISDENFDFYNYLDSVQGKDMCKIKHAYLWSYPYLMEENYNSEICNKIEYFDKNIKDNTLYFEKYNKVIDSKERLFENYEAADLYDITPAQEEDEFLINAILHILRLESPISCEILYKKVSQTLSGIYSLKEIEFKVLNLCDFTLNGYIKKANNFFWNMSDMKVAPRYRTFQVKLSQIAIEEQMLGLMRVTENSFGITLENLLKVTMREFGFDKITNDDLDELKIAFNNLVTLNHLALVGNKVVLLNK